MIQICYLAQIFGFLVILFQAVLQLLSCICPQPENYPAYNFCIAHSYFLYFARFFASFLSSLVIILSI